MVMSLNSSPRPTAHPGPASGYFSRPRPVSPSLRYWIMGRDGFMCRAPGCDRVDDLEVRHIDPDLSARRNHPANLVTICDRCFSLWNLMGRGPFLEETAHQARQAVNL